MPILFTTALYWATLLAQSAGPSHGTLFVVGGGKLGPALVQRFLALAGGPSAEIVYIPTADERNDFPGLDRSNFLSQAGATRVTILHTRDKAEADTDAFVAPLRSARAVWFAGGRQWRLVDSYLGTKMHQELNALLARGGVIGGTSAGATILGSFLVRGARSGNTIMIDPVYQTGLGFLRGVAVDQHLIARHRERDLLPVVARHPQLLGLGLDESTALEVRGDRCEVLGASKVAVYEHGKDFYWLSPGDKFNLKSRQKIQ